MPVGCKTSRRANYGKEYFTLLTVAMDPEGSGRGRGRGRGGVPVLPQGMWDALQTNSEKPTEMDPPQEASNSESSARYADAHEDGPSMPAGFGRGRGRGDFGRGGRGGGRGRGPERDMKGKDWECPSCTNMNWSWRTNCNKCNTGKPASALTDAENRDGAGKGFNERQDRMSAAAVEIDEEGFDDFGRRVKKDARADRRAKEEAALARMNEKYKHLLPTASVSETEVTETAGSSSAGAGNGSGHVPDRAPAGTDRASSSSNQRGDRDLPRRDDRGDASHRPSDARDRERDGDRGRDARERDRERERDRDYRREDTRDARNSGRDGDRSQQSHRDTTGRDSRDHGNGQQRTGDSRGGAYGDAGRKRERSPERGGDSSRGGGGYSDRSDRGGGGHRGY